MGLDCQRTPESRRFAALQMTTSYLLHGESQELIFAGKSQKIEGGIPPIGTALGPPTTREKRLLGANMSKWLTQSDGQIG